MNKPVYGLLLGGVLGIVDGLTAWFTPEVRPEIAMIVVGSSMKGILAGVLSGMFARKVFDVKMGTLFGLAIGALLAFGVASMPDELTGKHYYFQIMLPGSIVGAIVGYATQVYKSQSSHAN